jgi:hypothetical protein
MTDVNGDSVTAHSLCYMTSLDPVEGKPRRAYHTIVLQKYQLRFMIQSWRESIENQKCSTIFCHSRSLP